MIFGHSTVLKCQDPRKCRVLPHSDRGPTGSNSEGEPAPAESHIFRVSAGACLHRISTTGRNATIRVSITTSGFRPHHSVSFEPVFRRDLFPQFWDLTDLNFESYILSRSGRT